MATLLAILLATSAVCLTVTALALMRGWGISLLWNWFLVPLGLPVLGVVHAIGIGLTIAILTHNPDGKEDDRESKGVGEHLANVCGGWLAIIGVGWIVQYFM